MSLIFSLTFNTFIRNKDSESNFHIRPVDSHKSIVLKLIQNNRVMDIIIKWQKKAVMNCVIKAHRNEIQHTQHTCL